MKHSDFEQRCRDVARHWGQRMPMMAIEELAEMTTAVCKLERAYSDRPDMENAYPNAKHNLVDEIGDVLISIEALKHHYHIPQAMIDMRIEEKLGKSYPAETQQASTVSQPFRQIFEGDS